jgi:O-antigen ligase
VAVATRSAGTWWREIGAVGTSVSSSYLPAILTFAAVTAIGTGGGGFRPTVWRLGVVALLALTAAVLIVREQVELHRRELIALGLLAAFAAWTAISTLWSITPSRSPLAAERTLLYVAVLTLALLGAERSSLLSVVAGAVAGMTVVAAFGLGEHYLTSRPIDPVEGRLLIEPFGYANALGMYAAIGILLAGGLALSLRGRSARMAALAPAAVLVPTLLLSSSRAALAALAIGIAAALYLGRRIRSRPLLAALAVAGVALAVLVGANRGQSLSPVGEQRPHYWHVALYDYGAHPVLGSGAATFGDYFWRKHRPSHGFSRVAHSLYLETLAELGPFGLALLAAALLVPLAALRGRQKPLVAAAGGAYVAFLAHAAIDWDWQVAALTTAGFLCAGVVLVGTRRGPPEPISGRTRTLLLAGALALAALGFARFTTGPGLGF